MVGIVLTILAYVMGFLSIGFGVYGRDNMTWFRLAGAFACLLVLFVLFRLVNGSRSIAEVVRAVLLRHVSCLLITRGARTRTHLHGHAHALCTGMPT